MTESLESANYAINIEIAIAKYKAELILVKYPQQWAEIQDILGNAYCERIHGDWVKNGEKAIKAFEKALKVYTREELPQEWASIQNSLAFTYNQQGNINQAIACFRLLLKICTPTAFPTECLDYGGNFGDICLAAGRWKEAIEGYNYAVKSIEQIRAWNKSETRR